MFGFWNSDVILSARQISLEADFVPEGCGEADSVGQAVTVGVRNQCWIFPFFFLFPSPLNKAGAWASQP